MNKESFLSELEKMLSDISENEKVEALQYYRDYFEEAGEENEKQVIEDLGSPAKVAKIIKMSLNEGIQDEGEFSERGYSDPRFETNFEISREVNNKQEEKNGEGSSYNSYSSHENQYSGSYNSTNNKSKGSSEYYSRRKASKKRTGGEILLLLILLFLALPVGLPVIAVIISIGIAMIALIGGLTIGLAAVGIGLLIGGIALFASGIIKLFFAPITGITSIGAGLIMSGLGTLAVWFFVMLCIKVIPPMFVGIINLIRKPFNRGGII